MRFPIIEGFDHYPAITGVAGAFDTVWNNISAVASGFATGLGGENQCLVVPSTAGLGRAAITFPDSNKITCHFAFQQTARTANPQADFLTFLTSAFSRQFSLNILLSGLIQLLGEGGAVVATGTIPLLVGTIYRCCMRADLTTGTFAISINGDDDPGLNHTGLDIQDDPSSNLCGVLELRQMQDGLGGSISTYKIDDLIVGIDECTDWGPLEINTLPVNADVAVQFTRSTGVANYSNVDELPFTGDADYNYSNTVGQKDCFDFTDPPHVPDSVLAVQLMTLARKEESAVRKYREFLRIGGVDYNGDEHNLAETYGRFVSTWVNNPATAVPFTAADLNALRGGYELTEVD